jgi:hypothetical protein
MPCDFSNYKDFEKVVHASLADEVANAGHVEVAIDGPDGASLLHIFTGIAIIDFRPTDDDVLRRGTVRVRLNLPPLSPSVQFVDSATNAELASIFNNDDDVDTTFAVDCVSTQPEDDPVTQEKQVLTVSAAVAIEGAGGNTGLSRMAYQANVRLRVEKVQLDSLLVSDTHPPPDFQPSARFVSGQPWLGRVVLNGPAPGLGVFVNLASGDPSSAPVQGSVPVVGGQISADFTAPNTKSFTSPVEKDVTITASLDAIQKTATLKLLNIAA